MKLICAIPPNADGYVLAHFGAKEYNFAKDESGELTCEVDDDDHAKQLLGTGNFFPHDESDYDSAASILAGTDEDPDDDLDDEDDDELTTDPNALPVEALTPKKPRIKKV